MRKIFAQTHSVFKVYFIYKKNILVTVFNFYKNFVYIDFTHKLKKKTC